MNPGNMRLYWTFTFAARISASSAQPQPAAVRRVDPVLGPMRGLAWPGRAEPGNSGFLRGAWARRGSGQVRSGSRAGRRTSGSGLR